MRMKDIVPLRAAVGQVSFKRTLENLWEIHFKFGKGGEATQQCVTMHYPSEAARTWKNLDSAFNAAVEIFGPINKITIINTPGVTECPKSPNSLIA